MPAMTDDCAPSTKQGACPPFHAAGWPQELERPAIERGQSKIVVSYNRSELTSNTVLTSGSGHQGSRHEPAWASFTLVQHARGSLATHEPESKDHDRAQLACSAARLQPSTGAWIAKRVVSSWQLIYRPLPNYRRPSILERTTTRQRKVLQVQRFERLWRQLQACQEGEPCRLRS